MKEGQFFKKHVLVTGGGRGIGHAVAVAFARDGATVSVFSRTKTTPPSSNIRVYPCDVADRRQVETTFAAARQESGDVHALVNSAGVFLYRPFLDLTPEEWDGVLGINLTGAYNLCRAVLPSMVERRGGRIVNIASIHGLHGDANLAAHCASKFGLVGLTQSLAKELRRHNITVNAVCPGTTENRVPEHELSPREAPLAEKLRPQDVASAVLWLCSEEAAGITGASIEIYGGTQMRIEP